MNKAFKSGDLPKLQELFNFNTIKQGDLEVESEWIHRPANSSYPLQ